MKPLVDSDTVRTLHQSGAIDGYTSYSDAMIATRDTTQEINAKQLEIRGRGIIRDTAGAIEETAIAGRKTLKQ